MHYAYSLYEDYKSHLENLTDAQMSGQDKQDLDALYKELLAPYDMGIAINKLLHVQDNTIRGKSIHQLLR